MLLFYRVRCLLLSRVVMHCLRENQVLTASADLLQSHMRIVEDDRRGFYERQLSARCIAAVTIQSGMHDAAAVAKSVEQLLQRRKTVHSKDLASERQTLSRLLWNLRMHLRVVAHLAATAKTV